jgi:hypothetical protein
MPKITRFVPVFVLFCTFAVISNAETKKATLDADELEKEGKLVSLRMDRNAGKITLYDQEVIEDDGPATGIPEGYSRREWSETLKKGIVAKKILILDDPAAHSGKLVFKGGERRGNLETLWIQINGVKVQRHATLLAYPRARQFIVYSHRWYYVDMPVKALKKGENEILMWADSDSVSWNVMVASDKEFARGSLTRTKHPNRSMKSSNGGATWTDSRLGSADAIDGEYSIRLNLERYVKSGSYISPVFDLISDDPLKRLAKISRVDLETDIEAPSGTSVVLSVRYGSTPFPENASWSEWMEVDKTRSFANPRGRYIQIKADLSTSNPLVTPAIKGISYEVEWENLTPHSKAILASNVIHNGNVARSSVPMAYENVLHPELEKYRKNARLDEIVKGARNELEVMTRLLRWAYLIPLTSDEYSWNWNDVVKLEKGENGMPRLQSNYKRRRRDAMCLYSNQALMGALLSFGYQARHINIHSEGVSGHEIIEVWSNEFNKWMHMDATRDFYFFDPDTGIPHNVLDVHNLLIEKLPIAESWQRPFIFEFGGPQLTEKVRIGIREGENNYTIQPDGRHHIEIMGHFRVIPRNDFLTNPLPVPVHTGAEMWGWDGFLNWYDEKFPRRLEYQLQTDRSLDFYEPLNQAELYLNESSEAGVINVEIDTFTPGFETFLVKYDDGTWKEAKARFAWNLKPGRNRIDARVRALKGVLGPISTVELLYHP